MSEHVALFSCALLLFVAMSTSSLLSFVRSFSRCLFSPGGRWFSLSAISAPDMCPDAITAVVIPLVVEVDGQGNEALLLLLIMLLLLAMAMAAAAAFAAMLDGSISDITRLLRRACGRCA